MRLANFRLPLVRSLDETFRGRLASGLRGAHSHRCAIKFEEARFSGIGRIVALPLPYPHPHLGIGLPLRNNGRTRQQLFVSSLFNPVEQADWGTARAS